MLDISANTRLQNILSLLDKALVNRDIDAALDLFADGCYWRDFLTFTWNLKTLEGKDTIRAMLEERLPDVGPGNWKIDAGELAQSADGITQGSYGSQPPAPPDVATSS